MDKNNAVSMTFGDCAICGKAIDEFGTAVCKKCRACPECGEGDFVIYKHIERPYIFRCLNCLERYEK